MLKSLISEIRTIAASHAQINSIYYGDIEDWFTVAREAEKDVLYPAMFFVFTNVSISNKTKSLTLNMWFVDRLLPEYNNIADVHGDQMATAEEIVSKLRVETDRTWIAVDALNMELFTDRGVVALDNAGGVSATVTLEGPHAFDCDGFPDRVGDRIFTAPFNEVFS
jgi:hypothetical protein